MRILIYGEHSQAKEKMYELRKEGHHASLRNCDYFSPSETEKADLVIGSHEQILEAYQNIGVKTETFESAKDAKSVKKELATVIPQAKTAKETCRFVKKNGDRCSGKALEDGYCFVATHKAE
jgi:predicted ATP-grasp superfamily ATP-dependent carboligase